jgi:L-lactate permease
MTGIISWLFAACPILVALVLMVSLRRSAMTAALVGVATFVVKR